QRDLRRVRRPRRQGRRHDRRGRSLRLGLPVRPDPRQAARRMRPVGRHRRRRGDRPRRRAARADAAWADLTVVAPRRAWREALAIYAHPRVVQFLFLGFSAGLPFLLVFTTLSAWLRAFGVSRTAIGFLSWIGITYSIKFVWSPVVDRVPLPLLTRW